MTVTLQRDFDELRDGQSFSSRGRTITEGDIASFAGLTGDFHPQHVDAAWARDSAFGERVAHGMLVLSYAVGLVAFDPEKVVALRRVTDVVFKSPVLIGDTIHVEGRVESTRKLDDELGLVTTAWRVVTDAGRTAVRARVEVLWRRSQVEPITPATPELAADGLAPFASGLVVPL